MPCTKNSHQSRARKPARAATTTSGQNKGRKTVVTALTSAGGMTAVLKFRASNGFGRSSFRLEPSRAARTPSGRNLPSTRVCTLASLTPRPNCSVTASAICP